MTPDELRDEFNEVIIEEFLRRLFGEVPEMSVIAQRGNFVECDDGAEWFDWDNKFRCRICSRQEWESAHHDTR